MARYSTRINERYYKQAQARIHKPAAPAAKPPATQAPVPPGAQPLPIDQGYQNSLASNQQQYQNLLAQIGYQRNQLNSAYGFTPTYDGSGNITGESVDTSNPFSKAALLQQSYTRNKAGFSQGLAGQGQLYSSAYQADQDYAGQQYGQGYDALKRAYEQGQQGLTQQGTNALSGLSSNNANAYQTMIQNALASQASQNQAEINSGSYGSQQGFGAPASTGAPKGPKVPKQNVKPPKPRKATGKLPSGTRVSSTYRA
jgi:hypothetical protein